MITADQLVAHAVGDYILQSDWMATQKTKAHIPAFVHALTYSAVFLLFRPSLVAWATIFVTHFFIDRYRLARYVVWAKNYMLSPRQSWKVLGVRSSWFVCRETGYPVKDPAWLFVWLLIIADNLLHVLINGSALRFL